MIYRIICDGVDLYGPDTDLPVLNPHLEIELNSAGSLEFTLPVQNENWAIPDIFKNEIEVWEDNKIIWFGRPLQIVRDWNNQKRIVCEGALAYFNDSVQRTWEMQPSSTHTNVWFFHNSSNKGIIDTHNDQVDANKKFIVGTVDIDPVPAYRKTDYQTTLDCIQNMCLATDGGYIILRKEYEEGVAKRYIDWVQNMPDRSLQDVQFGLNLLDISQDLNGADVCTVLIPTGGNDLTLAELGNKNPADNDGVGHDSGSDEIYYQPGVEKYGRVVKQESWNDYTSTDGLWRKAKEWMIDKNTDIPTIECSAADLYYINGSDVEGPLMVGTTVHVVSAPHGIDKDLIMYKISMDLDSGVKKVTIGTPPKRELTDIIAPSSSGNSTRGNNGSAGGSSETGSGNSGSSGGTMIAPVQDVKVLLPGETNYKSVVKKKVAKIDLSQAGGGAVNDVTLDGTSVVDDGVAKLYSPNIPVTDVTLDDVSVVDDGVAKFDSSDFGTYVEANPSGTATDDLSSIQIGNDIYNIVGGGGSGGGSGVPYTCDELFVNDPLPSPTSGTSNVTRSYILSHSIDDYDAVYVMSYSEYNTNGVTQIVTQLILKKDYYDAATQSGYEDWVFLNNGSVGNTYRRLIMSFTDSTHIKTITGTRESGNEPILYKVYGLKFSSTIISPEIYSTEEREVGVFSDGKPLYEKIIELTKTDIGHAGNVDVSHGISNIDTPVSISRKEIRYGNGNMVSSYYYSSVWHLDVNDFGRTSIQVMIGDNVWNNMTANSKFAIGLQYTKTTDSPGSGTWTPKGAYNHVYSYTEHIIGKAVDGKVLYERTWDLGSQIQFPNNTWTDLGVQNVPSIDKIISHEGMQGTSATSINFDVWYDNGVIKAKSLRTENEHIRYLTLRYTKTNDTAIASEPNCLISKSDLYDFNTYSTTEHIVGKWIDGSSVYERTWDFGTSGASVQSMVWTEVPILLSEINPNMFISCEAIQINSGATVSCTAAPQASSSSQYVRLMCLRNQNETIRYLTLRYTKAS